jgi:DNA-directed RNA polymerase specialized sigma24 family protein
MDQGEWLVDRFEEHRPHLRAVAYRMLGSVDEADEAVQDAWLRVSRAGADGIENLRGWLTTIVARVCLNALQARKARPVRGHAKVALAHIACRTWLPWAYPATILDPEGRGTADAAAAPRRGA